MQTASEYDLEQGPKTHTHMRKKGEITEGKKRILLQQTG